MPGLQPMNPRAGHLALPAPKWARPGFLSEGASNGDLISDKITPIVSKQKQYGHRLLNHDFLGQPILKEQWINDKGSRDSIHDSTFKKTPAIRGVPNNQNEDP